MKSAIKTISEIQRHGLKTADDSLKIIPEDFPVGQYIPQGDINIWRLPEVPANAIDSVTHAQLAPGTTRGSRHVIKSDDLSKCKFFSLPSSNELQGPIIIFTEPVTIEHPEHGDQLWPACVVAITYQRRHADEVRRVQD